MTLKADYNECITNIASTIEKYFGLIPHHNVIDSLDQILNKYKPRNVVVILYDGMGYNLINRILDEDSFLRKNTIKSITSVHPATTTAATTSILSGLNPVEHGWLGWDVYIKPIDKIVTLFKNTLKDTEDIVADENVATKYLGYQSIISRVNELDGCYSKKIMPFGPDAYIDIDDMHRKILKECLNPSKNFIYAYYGNPDSIMHDEGTDSINAINTFKMINEKTEELSKKISDDTLVIVTADHGHINSKGILLSDYPDFYATLASDISIEARLCSFKVLDDKHDEFIRLFNKYFKDDFILLTHDEVIKDKVFGTGNPHQLFDSEIGDYLALAKTDKYFRYSESSVNLTSMHAGLTSDEMLIPLIVIKK